MLRLSEIEKVRIVILREQGKSWNEIKKETAIASSTARSVCSKMKKLEAWRISLQVAVLLS